MIDFTLVLIQIIIATIGLGAFTYFCWITENWLFYSVCGLVFMAMMLVAYV